ncbi:unnamed protein product [Cuscuta campestris]|uniref:Uncharacterized protein n=1 Tax=Cuscuta campestris TaxID=132261 RepID=A0A484MCP4_9ASTE|nr:unnamed protein product [Cuscuta campestris]
MAYCFAFQPFDKTAAGRHSSYPATLASSLALPPLPNPFSFYFRSVPPFTIMIVSHSNLASLSSSSRQDSHSASGHDQGHGEWASYASLSQRSSKLFTSDKKGSTKDWKPFFVFVSTGPESPFTSSGLPYFRCIPCLQPNATLLSITQELCGQGAVEIKVVTKESLAALGFVFVQDKHHHQPDLLRDFPGGSVDIGPFSNFFLLHQGSQIYLFRYYLFHLFSVEQEGLEEEMEGDLLISHFIAGRKRKRDAARQSRSKRSSSHGKDSPRQEHVVIEVEDQDDVALSEGPPSPPAVTYEVATEGLSTRFSIPPPSPSLGDIQLETLATLPAQYRARISAGSDDDLNNMVLLKLSQTTLGMIELVGWRQDCQAAMDEAKKAAEDK